ncbi:hypothetical protein EVAR_75344_1 [Eumeta japonica]|uniref:Uncharacterized protein n=1 Tax=Eumeta variegata TaxID=151549 RepID=A0A4C1T2R1_EUMVA|nr:hypothetical protein EVAR_75344_1 [Eumeta japonica]
MEKWKKWWSVEEVNIVRARAEALVHNGKSAVMGRGPEIGFQNVTLAVPVEEIAVDNAITSSEAEIICTESEIISRDPEIISTPLNVEISTEQVIVPVEQEALNQSQLSRTPAPAIPAASRILSTRPNTEDEEDAEPPRTAGRASTHRVDRRRRRRPTPFQMASVQFAEIEQRRLDLKERRLEVDRLREENIAQNRQLQEKFYRIRSSYDSQFQMLRRHEAGRRWNGADRAVQWRPTSCSLSSL